MAAAVRYRVREHPRARRSRRLRLRSSAAMVAASELILEGLVAKKQISSIEEIRYARAIPDAPPSFGSGGGTTNLFT